MTQLIHTLLIYLGLRKQSLVVPQFAVQPVRTELTFPELVELAQRHQQVAQYTHK